jgi:hypothetical protein
MSGIAAFALGFSAARALRGRTWADSNVLFEPNAPVEVTAPLICVWSGLGRSGVVGGDLLNGASDVRLRFDFWLPPRVTADGVTFDAEAGQSLVFALLWRQVETALLTDTTVWADLWRRIRLRVHSITAARDLYEPEKGMRIPANVVELHCETLAEPPVGEPPSGVWADFVAAMRADTAEIAGLADLIAAQIQASDGVLPDWQVAMGLLGTTAAAIAMIGIGPADDSTPAVDTGDGAAAQEEVDVSAAPEADI